MTLALYSSATSANGLEAGGTVGSARCRLNVLALHHPGYQPPARMNFSRFEPLVYMTIPSNKRYSAVEEEDGSWSVIDCSTNLPVLLSNEPMTLLQERFAHALATFLNLEDQTGGKLTLQ